MQKVLEAEENVDSFHDEDEFELDTPKRKNKNRGKVSGRQEQNPRFIMLEHVCGPTVYVYSWNGPEGHNNLGLLVIYLNHYLGGIIKQHLQWFF